MPETNSTSASPAVSQLEVPVLGVCVKPAETEAVGFGVTTGFGVLVGLGVTVGFGVAVGATVGLGVVTGVAVTEEAHVQLETAGHKSKRHTPT